MTLLQFARNYRDKETGEHRMHSKQAVERAIAIISDHQAPTPLDYAEDFTAASTAYDITKLWEWEQDHSKRNQSSEQ